MKSKGSSGCELNHPLVPSVVSIIWVKAPIRDCRLLHESCLAGDAPATAVQQVAIDSLPVLLYGNALSGRLVKGQMSSNPSLSCNVSYICTMWYTRSPEGSAGHSPCGSVPDTSTNLPHVSAHFTLALV